MWQREISTPNYEKILSMGLSGIIAEIDKKRFEVLSDISIPTEKRMKMIDELTAMKISTEAAARWGQRYAKMLQEHKMTVKDKATRHSELGKMIEACSQVPAGPARRPLQAHH